MSYSIFAFMLNMQCRNPNDEWIYWMQQRILIIRLVTICCIKYAAHFTYAEQICTHEICKNEYILCSWQKYMLEKEEKYNIFILASTAKVLNEHSGHYSDRESNRVLQKIRAEPLRYEFNIHKISRRPCIFSIICQIFAYYAFSYPRLFVS